MPSAYIYLQHTGLYEVPADKDGEKRGGGSIAQ